MAALPKFSFSGWNSQSLAPKVPILPRAPEPSLPRPGAVGAGPIGTLVGNTGAANTNLPGWLQAEVDRINAQDALRTAMLGGTGGGSAAPPENVGNILQGIAAVTGAQGRFNTSMNQINEQSRLQNLIQQRSMLQPTGGFGFNSSLDVPRQMGLDSQISGYRNVNLPFAAGAVGGFNPTSGWASPYRMF